jgi:hypothetical protein
VGRAAADALGVVLRARARLYANLVRSFTSMVPSSLKASSTKTVAFVRLEEAVVAAGIASLLWGGSRCHGARGRSCEVAVDSRVVSRASKAVCDARRDSPLAARSLAVAASKFSRDANRLSNSGKRSLVMWP